MRKEGVLINPNPKEEKQTVDLIPFESILDFHFDKCQFERNPATGEIGWHAPKGYVFRIEGKFCVKQSELIKEGWEGYVSPRPGKDLFVEEYGYEDEYKDFLETAKGDSKKALRLLIKDIKEWGSSIPTDYIPEFFTGKWIFIESEDGKSIFDSNPDEILSKLTLKIASEAEVFENNDFLEVITLQSEDTKTTTKIAFPSDLTIDYTQNYAEAVLGGCRITLVKKREKKQGLVAAKPRPISIVEPLWSIEVKPTKLSEPLKPGDVRF